MIYSGKSKYRNAVINTPDGKFDSKKEYQEWCQLKLMQKAGIIKELERQKEIQLIPTIYTTEETLRKTSYIADFFYYDNELQSYVVHDTKGFKTDLYNLKKRLVLWLYPNLVFVESGKKRKVYRNKLEVK